MTTPPEDHAALPAAATAPRAVTTLAPGKLGVIIFLATDTMGFGGLFVAYADLRVRAETWPDPGLRFARGTAAFLTVVLLASGATMSAAREAARAGGGAACRRWLAATAALGLAFVAGQAFEFRALVVERHVGLTLDHAASLFYVIAGYHGLHVIVGILWLVGLASKAASASPNGRESRGVDVEIASLYWQFVDLVWIVIFTLVYLLPVPARG